MSDALEDRGRRRPALGAGSRAEFLAGVRAELPLLVGVFPFGLIYGLLAIRAGIGPAAAQGMSSIVFAGSAQFLAAQLFHEVSPPAVIVLTIAVVNLRHMLYSASVSPYVQHLSMRWKALLAYLLTDEAYAVVITRYQRVRDHASAHWFYLGAGLALWSTWQLSTALGVFVGAELPAAWPLDFALPLTFIAIVVPAMRDRASVAAGLSAGVAALVAFRFPYGLGLIAAAFVGIAAGVALERKR